ncbi:MAG: LysR family transcriptional regulator, partial [Oceanococcaceae bacterium]
MRELNLKHLHYFWVVASERSITAAGERLFVTPQTISAQIRELEDRLRCQLFDRRGRALVLTPAGETALRYSNAIFDLSKELVAALSENDTGQQQVRIGIVDVVPKLISSLLLLPLLRDASPPRLHCREGALSELMADLVRHQIDAVISDHAAPPDPNLRLYSHELGSTGLSFLAAPHLVADTPGPFPQCLNGLPVILPGRRTALRMSLENWLREH